MNQASHYIDLLGWLIGPVESVQAYSATLERNIEAEDTAVAALRWRSGALGLPDIRPPPDQSCAIAGRDRPIERGYRCRSEEHTSELQSLMRISYAVFCLTKKTDTSAIQSIIN